MKKNGVLNKDIVSVIASMGHNDLLVICPAGVRCIDVSVCRGSPDFLTTVRAVAEDLCVDRWIVAEETAKISPPIFKGLETILGEKPFQQVSHEHLKSLSQNATAIIRTGECTPYANVILIGGVTF